MKGLPTLYKADRLVAGAQGMERKQSRLRFLSVMAFAFVVLFLSFSLLSSVAGRPLARHPTCSTVDKGYQCFPHISRLWGQYSPYFSVEDESAPSQDLPGGCEITMAQMLSRHGARYPTDSKSKRYAELIAAIQRNATSFRGKAAFLESYDYTLGANDLTTFGQQQMVDSGVKFYRRYLDLTRESTPFIRASGSDRVIASAELFIDGFQRAIRDDMGSEGRPRPAAPVVDVIIPEGEAYNNTLDHSTCTVFEADKQGDEVEANFTAQFTAPIRKRLQSDLPGVDLTPTDVVSLMDMCSFDTVARTPDASELAPFCALFTHEEWIQYDYKQSLSKYYGYGAGNPLGPAQGIGFTNELIARLTRSPVQDSTSTNTTLTSDPATFPLNATLYADFSHDNTMISIYFAMGLYNGTDPLSLSSVETIAEMDGYAASWTAPFGGRAYFELMQCGPGKEELVRVLVNDRVVPLHGCEVDELGRCRLDDFVEGLSFARSGGNWGECFA